MTIAPWLWVTLAWLLSVGPVATLILWGWVWIRLEHVLRVVPTLRTGQRLAAADPPAGRVVVVVPAYNETRVIAGLVRSLREETYAELRFVLALDRCTDNTAELARAAMSGDERFEIIEIDTCPADWVGKVHALHAGVTRSRAAADADFLLFADADTLFAPGCIAASLALMRQRELDLLSLLSTLAYHTWFERVVQTATAMELMRRFPLTRANRREARRAFANGQFMLFRRDAYEAVGGHAAVHDSLFEDVELARRVDLAKRNGGVFMADGLFHCRMYGDWPQFRRGWKRIFTEASYRKPRRLAFWSLQVRLLGTLFPAWMLVAGLLAAPVIAHDAQHGWGLLALFVLAFVVWLGALLRITAMAHAPAWTAPLHLVGAWLTGVLLSEAARDVRARAPTQWGGREYHPRGDGA